MSIQWAILGLGALVGVLGVTLWFVSRERYTAPLAVEVQAHNQGLIRQDADSTMPENSSPGMIGTLDDGFVSAHDILISIVDLAARGWLGIWRQGNEWTLHRLHTMPLSGPNSTTDLNADADGDAVVQQSVSVPSQRPLLPTETALLEALFNNADTVTIDGFFAETQAYDEVLTQLQFAADDTGWFTDATHNRWGLIGAGFVALGLVFAGVSLVDGLPTIQWPGLAGAVAAIAAGALVASLARLHRDYTGAGEAARTHLDRYRSWLTGMAAHDLPAEKLTETFNAHIAAALAFGIERDFATVFTRATERLAAWGRPPSLEIAWINGATTPEQCTLLAERFISEGTALAAELGLN
ncbi:MAG: DUF2207 domain-containing protein [Propionibacteriaceae bacterium]|jgi:hypothetical protein|nr:DUF2207 domain-containing protein [Propionibacteriaceae bacterium]